ncbi:hypothetical protein SAMN05428642_1011089 [Flaviramulus basaltis]|uniref:4-O-methyl-glucuronoyl methylesterase-like domain-containing protein n=1 Tax=Flaviramulus basaltis TaxID=369401 RepID=A0A1K2IE54_9FLAO|nr:acetylxylan esterase [Flaviramulus basaltis]SFZ90701.1 hypothetical protein SAMN05428642_1011089 [Flaviramulus basaltis]
MKPQLLILFLLASIYAFPQFKLTPEQESIRTEINKKTQTDYNTILQQLGITEIRPGANGNDPNAENAANYDETKADIYTNYPNPLIFNNGNPVTTAEDWQTRRLEIIADFENEVYGKLPENIPSVTWHIIEEKEENIDGIAVTRKTLEGKVDNSSYPEIEVNLQLSVSTPSNIKSPVPVMLMFGFSFPDWFPKNTFPQQKNAWQTNLLKQGWGFADLKAGSVQPDNGAGLTKGIIGLTNKGKNRTPEQWGSLRAWAWGASRVLDYFEKDNLIDATKVGITGHSRYGKAALVTLAFDERFAIGFISSSGAGGASLFRRNYGEVVENVASSGEYHWMAGNFIKYAGPLNWNDLPVDAHELIALCAPRPVFISSGNKGDNWVDPKGMFLAAVKASPVYELLEKKGIETAIFPPVETALIKGDVSYRQHNQGHVQTPNWETFIEFATRYFD